MVGADPFADRGMGEVSIEQPDPFDIFVDAKSRDILFRDAAYVMIRKILPKGHLKQKFPDSIRKINNASARYGHETNHSTKTYDDETKDFTYKDIISGAGGGQTSGPSYTGVDAA